MNIATAKHQIKDTVEAYLSKDDAGIYVIAPVHQRPLFLIGAPGIGKTAIMEQVAQELEIGLVSYSMTHHTRQSALGLPRIVHHSYGDFEYEASEYTMSEIIASVYEYMKNTGQDRGILFLDEINSVSETLYPSMLQFLQFKVFGKHKVPDGWIVVCAGNPPEYNRSVHEFDIVTLDRLREIHIEPDYAAWKEYASAKGLHPSVTTFLETKRDSFYKVEAKPGGGKAFVTARGWEDLASLIAQYEHMGKLINRELIAQFLHDDEIADQFSVYYSLFEKYRSDYQVDTIVAGQSSDAIKERSKKAAFDERLALIGLLLDVVARKCTKVLDHEAVLLEVRDVLREVKAKIEEGGEIEVALQKSLSRLEKNLAHKKSFGTFSRESIRKDHLVVEELRKYVSRYSHRIREGAQPSFSLVEKEYKLSVAELDPSLLEANTSIDNAFDFVDECFGDHELLVFMAELATRQATTRFIAHYGNEKYYEHSRELQADSARMGLKERADMLVELSENIQSESRAQEQGRGSIREEFEPKAIPLHSTKPTITESGNIPEEVLREYYEGKQFEGGFTGVCKMHVPADRLKGKKVLDVCCRRGKGVYKLSSMVGNHGRATGTDWVPAYIEEAKEWMEHARVKSGLSHNNMEFHLAYPENLITAGIGTETLDAVYVNNVITLFYDQEAALKEFNRVLKPGGLLIMETIYASEDLGEDFVEQGRSLGNSILAARTKEQNEAWLEGAGFAEPEIKEEYEVEPHKEYKEEANIDDIGDATFRAVALYATKK